VYFEDLSAYQYSSQHAGEGVLNVGWLSVDRPYARGASSTAFQRNLEVLVRAPVAMFRGFHFCEFCLPPRAQGGHKALIPGTYATGEIRVRGNRGIIYAAPALIFHYVAVHGYLPPREFVEAVESATILPD
jgi:hypothetical protein